jgi:hypothetical protein
MYRVGKTVASRKENLSLVPFGISGKISNFKLRS